MQTQLLTTKKNSIFHMLNYCIFIGFVSGYAASFYTLLVEKAAEYSAIIYNLIEKNEWYIALIAGILFLAFLICTHVVRLSNVTRGSGVPQALGLLRGAFIMKWVRGLIVMVTCSLVATFVGLSLGSEGPSMIIGGLAAMGASKLFPMYTRNYMVTGGVSAGIAVAFNAPLSGVMITLEEGHKRFSPVIAFNSLVIVAVAMITSYAILGYRTIVPVHDFLIKPIDIPFLMLLGIVVVISGIVFNTLLLALRKLTKKLKFKHLDLRYMPAFVLALLIGVFMPLSLGGGLPIIKSLLVESFTLKTLLVLSIVKLLFTIVCTSNGIPGGIFVPMLSCGAIVGAMYAQILGLKFDVQIELYIVAAMVAYFTSVSHGYFTAIMLAVELTHNPLFAIPAMITCSVTKLLIHVLHTKGLYDELLNLTIKENTTKMDEIETFKLFVGKGSFADGRLLCDLILPTGVKIIQCNHDNPSDLRPDRALQHNDLLYFEMITLDNQYAKNVIISLLTSKNVDDDLDGVPPNVTL